MTKNEWETELKMNDKDILVVRTYTKPECEVQATTSYSSTCTKILLEKNEELAKELIGEKVLQQIKSIKGKING